jgi:hypothetical protein
MDWHAHTVRRGAQEQAPATPRCNRCNGWHPKLHPPLVAHRFGCARCQGPSSPSLTALTLLIQPSTVFLRVKAACTGISTSPEHTDSPKTQGPRRPCKARAHPPRQHPSIFLLSPLSPPKDPGHQVSSLLDVPIAQPSPVTLPSTSARSLLFPPPNRLARSKPRSSTLWY